MILGSNRSARQVSRLAAIALALGVIAGCDGESKTTSGKSDSGVSDKPAVDPNIAKAVAAASARGPQGRSRTPGQEGPPPNGVFEAGEADKQLAKGAPPKIALGGEGTEPKITLAMQPKPGFKRDLTVQIILRSGPRQGMPPIDFGLGLEAAKPKPAAAPGAAPAPAPAVASAAEPIAMSATVKAVRISPSQAAGVPKEFDTELAKLKGSKIEFRIAPNGAGDGFHYQMAKAADPGLENAVRSLTEALASLTLPYPDKPIGAGAVWMATTRETAIGVEVVAYRIIKLESITDGKIKLSVNIKRYATGTKFDLPELPKDATFTLEQFDSQGEGQLEIAKEAPLPLGGELTLTLNASLIPSNQPDQRAAVQSQTRAAFTLSPK
jgi:hypothetical protein